MDIPKCYANGKNVQAVLDLPMFQKLRDFVSIEYETKLVYPPKDQVYAALEHTPLEQVKVVILGQDPYIHEGQAHGLSFSVNKGVSIPPSLANIFTEIKNTHPGWKPEHEGNLSHWASQGVLMLNSVLTVRAGSSNSHASKGWERLTDAIIKDISETCPHVVFMLWGQKAKDKAALVSHPDKHLILTAMHPSPLAKTASGKSGFLGCDHFRKANKFLKDKGLSQVVW